jgi:hypothetical protein
VTTYPAIVPTATGADAGPANTAALTTDRISCIGSRLLIIFENAGAGAITVTLEDARTLQFAGAPASATFADLGLTVPITDRVALLVPDVTRFKDPTTGLIALTFSGVTTVTWQSYEI